MENLNDTQCCVGFSDNFFLWNNEQRKISTLELKSSEQKTSKNIENGIKKAIDVWLSYILKEHCIKEN